MLLDLLSKEPYVQLGFLIAIMVIACAAMAMKRFEKAQILEAADKQSSRSHDVELWRVKQGVIEHKSDTKV